MGVGRDPSVLTALLSIGSAHEAALVASITPAVLALESFRTIIFRPMHQMTEPLLLQCHIHSSHSCR